MFFSSFFVCVFCCGKGAMSPLFVEGYLTGLDVLCTLQVSIDLLSWDFSVMTVDDSNISGAPKVRH